ncbi:AraC family transcriptional regulator [Paenibacillus sp. LHD-117]|uniref:AraC family transcriptional regulator n=1 Tax=Paenibacillus sp. LHD-117 TaxID=3071412 RepID=UPI0027E04C73|nr:AraC family transcriptional regulator [Paenibacillus sp. LHD-117]MDQ6419121.1 AraC family transcriptional regulator [Paenibacillus sp. LHD-117]
MPAIQPLDLNRFPLYFVYKRKSVSEEQFKNIFHAHQGIELLLVHEGMGTLIVNQRSYDIRPGTVCVFQPYQLHDVRMNVSESQPFVRSIVHYEPAHYESYFDKWPNLQSFFKHLHKGKLHSPYRFGPEAMERLSEILLGLDERIPALSKDRYFEEFSLFLLVFFRMFMQVWEQKQPDESGLRETRTPHPAEKIMEWVERHYREPLRLERMSKELHLSAHHLSHLFKENTGSSITDYWTAKRMQQAVLLLLSGDSPVARIAEEVGIANCSHFCKQFKTHFGETPYRYRKRWQDTFKS